MARTQEQIEQEILAEKAKYTELSELNSVSQTAIWRLWIKMTAFATNALEKLFDVFRNEILEIISKNRTGTLVWYAEKAKAFQFGDTLNNLGEYDVVDENKKIITRCSVSEVLGGVSIKIAKNEPAEQLTATELQSFTQYINQIKFAGVATTVVNLPAEPVIVDVEIFYKDISENTALDLAKQAISGYLKQIDFDGQFATNDLIAVCRANKGIVDVLVNSIEINGNAVVNGRYNSLSGYYNFDKDDTNHNFIMTAL